MTNPAVLIVDDDTEEQGPRLLRIVKMCLPGWDVRTAASVDKALELIPTLQDLRVAVVDRHLTHPPVNPDGLKVLEAIQKAGKDCYKILLSSKSKPWEGISRSDKRVDAFVSLAYDPREEPQAELETALLEAKKRFDFPDSKPVAGATPTTLWQ